MYIFRMWSDIFSTWRISTGRDAVLLPTRNALSSNNLHFDATFTWNINRLVSVMNIYREDKSSHLKLKCASTVNKFRFPSEAPRELLIEGSSRQWSMGVIVGGRLCVWERNKILLRAANGWYDIWSRPNLLPFTPRQMYPWWRSRYVHILCAILSLSLFVSSSTCQHNPPGTIAAIPHQPTHLVIEQSWSTHSNHWSVILWPLFIWWWVIPRPPDTETPDRVMSLTAAPNISWHRNVTSSLENFK